MKKIIKTSILLLLPIFGAMTMTGQFAEERKIEENEVIIDNQQMNIVVYNESTGKAYPSEIRIKGLNPRKTVVLRNVTDTVISIKNYRLYTVSAIEKGFMYYNDKFWPDEVQIHFQKIQLKPLQIGLKTNIRDIYFQGDKTSLYAKSEPAVDELIEWMRLNPNVKIAVIGHVNGPNDEKSERFFNKVSLERANSVVAYMITKGITTDRLMSKGKGNTEMIFPDPKTNWENEANRRVEIEVIGL